jgi:hypothetical protein
MTLKEWLDDEKARTAMLRPATRRGTQEWLARKLMADQGLVSRWVRRLVTPKYHGAAIVRLSRGKVTMAELERVK